MEERKLVLDDSAVAVPRYSPVCTLCAHYRRGRSCAAYPGENAIPLVIWTGKDDHTEPHAGDHGIRFQRVDQA